MQCVYMCGAVQAYISIHSPTSATAIHPSNSLLECLTSNLQLSSICICSTFSESHEHTPPSRHGDRPRPPHHADDDTGQSAVEPSHPESGRLCPVFIRTVNRCRPNQAAQEADIQHALTCHQHIPQTHRKTFPTLEHIRLGRHQRRRRGMGKVSFIIHIPRPTTVS